MVISGLLRGFSTCCLRFKSGVATTHAKLASGRLARLCREGVEPSGSLRKVSDHILVPLSWIYPGATSESLQRTKPRECSARRDEPRAMGISLALRMWPAALATHDDAGRQ